MLGIDLTCQAVQNNGSLFAHIVVSQTGAASNPADPNFDPERSFHAVKRKPMFEIKLMVVLSRYMPKRKEVHLKKLIKSTEETENNAEAEVTSHLTYLRVDSESPTDCVILA